MAPSAAMLILSHPLISHKSTTTNQSSSSTPLNLTSVFDLFLTPKSSNGEDRSEIALWLFGDPATLEKRFQEAFELSYWSSMISWVLTTSTTVPKVLKYLATQATLNQIWRARNDKHFSGIIPSPTAIVASIDRTVKDVLLARRTTKHYTGLLQRWLT